MVNAFILTKQLIKSNIELARTLALKNLNVIVGMACTSKENVSRVTESVCSSSVNTASVFSISAFHILM